MAVYGKDFAFVYNRKWNDFTEKIWPFLIRLIHLYSPKGLTWLDLCCGTGALLQRAATAGYSLIGLDSSIHQLRFARKNSPLAQLICEDVRLLALRSRFDILTCMYDSFNYLLEPKELEQAMCRIKDVMHAQSLFIFDMNTYEGLQDHWNRTFTVKFPHGIVLVDSSFNEKEAVGTCRLTGIMQQGSRLRRFREEHRERGYSGDEIHIILEKTGFTYTAYDGDRLTQPGMRPSRLLYICRPI